MRGILINPDEQTILEIIISGFNDLYPLIGCELVQPVPGDTANTIWLDEEGLLRKDPQLWELGGEIFAGRAVILGGASHDEDPTDCEVPVDFIRALITFRPDICYAGMTSHTEEVDHPHLGRMTQITNQAVYRPRSLS